MAAADWRSPSLIASIRRRGNAPSSNEGWNDADFLAAINEELRGYLVPLIRRTNEDYLVAYTDTTTTTAARYRIPEAAMGESLKDVGFVVNGVLEPLERVSPGRSAVGGYYLEDEDVVLTPAPVAGQTLRMKYVRRPSKVVGDARAIAISSIAGGTVYTTVGTYALDGVTEADTLGPLMQEFASVDLVSPRPGFRTIEAGRVPGYNDSLNRFTWDQPTVSVPTVGDYICYGGESPVPQVPAEAHPLLAQAVLCQYLKATDRPGALEERARMESDLIGLLAPRTENQPHRTVNTHSPGWSDFYGRRIGRD